RSPCVGGVEVETDDGVGQSELGVLFNQIGDLIACQVAANHIRFRLPHFQKIGAEICYVRCDQLIAQQRCLIGVEESFGSLEQVMAENVVGGQGIEFLAVHHVVAL